MTTIRTGICAALILLTYVPAQATDLPAQGGPGGGKFRAECPSGQYLVGVSIKAGSWVDAIYTLCASFLADQGRFGQWTRGQRQGGTGGSALLKDAACPSDRVVRAINFGWTRTEYSYIDYVELQCSPIATGSQSSSVCVHTGDGCWKKNPNPPPTTFPGGLSIVGDEPFKQGCPLHPKLEVATGLHGRSGAFVDALGLICGPAPDTGGASPPIKSMRRIGRNTNLPGSDYNTFETKSAQVEECRQACNRDAARCKAWTWVKPGVQHSMGTCWLKNAVPKVVPDNCCISGLVTAAAATSPTVKSMKKTPMPAEAGGGAVITCTIVQPVDVCPTTDGCDDNTRIGVLTQGSVTVLVREGPWHKVKVPAGDGWAYSGPGYVSLNCP